MSLECLCGIEIPREGTDFEPQCRHCEHVHLDRLAQNE